MKIAACRSYHSRTVGSSVIRMPDGKSAFKFYYISIVGRDQPERYEWARCALSRPAFEARFAGSGIEGVGFVTAFPHITKCFRFAPAAETVLHVRAFNTADLTPLSLDRDDRFVEFACYAEAAIAADEYHAWARAATVTEYLDAVSAFVDGPIARHDKLKIYAEGEGSLSPKTQR